MLDTTPHKYTINLKPVGARTVPDKETRIIVENNSPVVGILSVVIGLIGVFVLSFILSPVSLILGIIASFKGQILTGVIGIVLSIVGIMTSPILLGMLGIGTLLSF
jgi:hypothetical protein